MLYYSTSSTLLLFLALEGWLIVLTALVWWFIQFVFKRSKQKYLSMIDLEYISASDFTIMLDNVPAYYTK